jgi:hypothetical protein
MRMGLAVSVSLLSACGSQSPSSSNDAGHDASLHDAASDHATSDAPLGDDSGCHSETCHCGQPGDVGNSLGVGKYCQHPGDCSGTKAILCSTLGGPSTSFCTFLCTPTPDGGVEAGADAGEAGAPTDCGEGATCLCESTEACGCVPIDCHLKSL